MFSENDQISSRQVQYLLLMDWFARLFLLLPICLSGRSMGSALFCVLAGSAVWYLIAGIFVRQLTGQKKEQEGSLCCCEVASRFGWGTSLIYHTAILLAALVQASVFLNLTSHLCSIYLLPEMSIPLICLLPTAAAVFLSAGSIEVQGRFCEVTGPIVAALLVGLLVLTAYGVELPANEDTVVQLSDRLEVGSFEVFACLGGLFLPMLRAHQSEHLSAYKIKNTGLFAALAAGGLCVLVIGSYGKNGMNYISFPAIRVMSNLRLPGIFLQRWDVLFLGLLLVCLTVTASSSLWYAKEAVERLWELAGQRGQKELKRKQSEETILESTLERMNPEVKGTKTKKSENAVLYRTEICWCACILLVYLAAAGFLSAWSAISYYRALNLQVLTPLFCMFYLALEAQRQRKRAVRNAKAEQTENKTKTGTKGRTAILLGLLALSAAAVFLLTGCTAYEPEERLFPMALEIRADGEELVMAYAWDEGTAPGSVKASGKEPTSEAESESEKEGGASGQKETEEASGASGQKETEEASDASGQKKTHEAYAENRNGITVFRGRSLEEIQKKTNLFSERYMDYSHVKAVLLDDSLGKKSELERTIVTWMAGEPAFATGLIIYRIQEENLVLEQIQKQSGGAVGTYLENLYQNNAEYRERSTTLGALISGL